MADTLSNDTPEYLTEQTEETIIKRMLDSLPLDLDKSEGSYIWDAVAPAAIELAQAAILAQGVLQRGFASTTFGTYLDMRCAEHGVTRRPAARATGEVKFSGTSAAVILVGTIVATLANPNTNTPSIQFRTVTEGKLVGDQQGHWFASVAVEAVDPGSSGNVPAGSIEVFNPVSGVTGVTNLAPTTGGIDVEADSPLLARFLQRVRQPSTGGNKADYVAWTMEVPGVGAASVVPVRDGPGTVSIAIVDTDMEPAEQLLVDSVQNYIAPRWVWEKEAEEMTIGGNGVTVDNTQTDDKEKSIKMVYNSTGNGILSQPLLALDLPRPGIWRAHVKVKVSANTGSQNLLELGVWNITDATWCKTTPMGSVNAQITLKGNQLSTTFEDRIVEFYWDGQDEIKFQATRLIGDTVTTVWIDRVIFRSKFSKDTGEGKAPVGATVTVEPATIVSINISAVLDIMPDYDTDSVISACEANIQSYLKSLVFAEDNDIRYSKIGDTIIRTPGVRDYLNLLMNNVTSNINIGAHEIAVALAGGVTLTT